MRIASDIVQKIQDTAQVVEVIGDFVSLKRSGKDYKACCPFHNEKTPSFYISPAKNIYKCFGCGKAGNPTTFVMEHEGVGYVEALKYLAKKYQIEIPEEAYQAPTPEEILHQNEKESVLVAIQYANKFFQEQLYQTEEGKTIGLSYFKQRGFQQQTLKTFELGYSPERSDAFAKHAISLGYNPEILEKAGLISIKENTPHVQYDRFRERVIFPIHNVSGKVIAFGGRTLRKDKNVAKYINSPETPVYNKSQVLYGLFQAKKNILQKDACYLVEGYADVISLHQAGIENVVASSGTSLTVEQIRLIRRFTENITMLYDGDEAGIKAAMRGVDLILEENMNVRILTFPNGEDPDTFVQKVGTNGFNEYLKENEKSFIIFKTNFLLKDAQNDPLKRAEALREIVNTIVKIPDVLKRSIFAKDCAILFQIDEQVIISEINKTLLKESTKKYAENKAQTDTTNNKDNNELTGREFFEQSEKTDKPAIYYQEQESIRLLINYGGINTQDVLFGQYLLKEIENITFETPIFQEILGEFRYQLSIGLVPEISYFTNHENADIQKVAIDLLTEKYEISPYWADRDVRVSLKDEKLEKIAYNNIMWLKYRVLSKKIEENNKRMSDPNTLDEALGLDMELKAVKTQIAKILGVVIG